MFVDQIFDYASQMFVDLALVTTVVVCHFVTMITIIGFLARSFVAPTLQWQPELWLMLKSG